MSWNNASAVVQAFKAVKNATEAKNAVNGKASWFDGLMSGGKPDIKAIVAMIFTVATALNATVAILVADVLGDSAEKHLEKRFGQTVAKAVGMAVNLLAHTAIPLLQQAVASGSKLDNATVDSALKAVTGKAQSTIDFFFPSNAVATGPTWGDLATPRQEEALSGLLFAAMASRRRDRTTATRLDDDRAKQARAKPAYKADHYQYGLHGLEGVAYQTFSGLVWLRDNNPAELARIVPKKYTFDQVFDDPKGTCSKVIVRAVTVKEQKTEFWLDTMDVFVPKDGIRKFFERLWFFIRWVLVPLLIASTIIGSLVGILALIIYHFYLILLAGYGLAWFLHGLGITQSAWPWHFVMVFFGRWGSFDVNLPALLTGMLVLTGLWRHLWAPPGSWIRAIMRVVRKVDPQQNNLVGGFVRSLTFWAKNHGWLSPSTGATVTAPAKADEPMTWWRRFAITANLIVLAIGMVAIGLGSIVEISFTMRGLGEFILTWALVGGLGVYMGLELVALNFIYFPASWREKMSQTGVRWIMRVAIACVILSVVGVLSLFAVGGASLIAYGALVENGWLAKDWYINDQASSAPASAPEPIKEDPTADERKRMLEKHGR